MSRRAASLLTILALASAGCASAKYRAEHAMERGENERALEILEAEIEAGSRDPSVYYLAARSAARIGDFGAAERHYSRAVRYGAGPEVIEEFAHFYVRSSNFTRAAQVFEALLPLVPPKRKQPIYNDLGTALLYAGAYIQAEAYLLLAQQADPSDPIPYLNLGLLYDRHFRVPRRGAAFYACYLKLAREDALHRPPVLARQSALAEQLGAPAPTECDPSGIAPDALTNKERRDALAALKQEAASEDVELLSAEALAAAPPEPAAAPEPPLEPGERADQAERRQQWGEVIAAFDGADPGTLSNERIRQLARAYDALGEVRAAESWLRLSLAREPRPEELARLVEILRSTGRAERVAEACDRYAAASGGATLGAICAPSAP